MNKVKEISQFIKECEEVQVYIKHHTELVGRTQREIECLYIMGSISSQAYEQSMKKLTVIMNSIEEIVNLQNELAGWLYDTSKIGH